MRTLARCIALAALLPLFACSSFEQRVVAVENRQSAVEQQIAELQQAQADISARLARVQSEIDGALDPLRVQQADRGENLRALQREVTAMEEQMAEMDTRIGLLRDEMGTGGGTAGATAGPAMPPARGQRTVDAGGPEQAPPDESMQLYNGAYGDYLRGNYELCVQGFGEFVRLYPTSPRAANSHYWSGMCQRDLGRLDEARQAFDRVIRDFPDSEVVADAMFMDALILRDAGREDEAAEAFRRLIQAYPNRDQALLACGQLSELGADLPEVCGQ
jgi:tol-pal system protein YbgF